MKYNSESQQPNRITMEIKTNTNPVIMSKIRILKNVFAVCLGFLFLFSAYQGLANLQSTLNIEGNLGVISQSVIYAAMIVSALFLPKLVIKKFGCKKTMVVSILLYVPYMAVNLIPSMSTFVPTAIVVGIAAPALWSAKCTYINEISVLYASQSTDSSDEVTSKFFGIFFMSFQSTQIWGNLISYYVLRPSEEEIVHESSYVNETVACGVDFCFGINENLKSPSDGKKYMLISIYLLCVIVAACIIAIFMDSHPKKEPENIEGIFSKILATLKQLKKPNQLLLLPITIFSGLEQGFILGDYTKAYVACAWGIYHVGLVFIFFGIVDALVSLVVGRLVKYVSRVTIFVSAALGNVAVCTILFLWQPNSDQYFIFFILIAIWGFSDAIWQTLINAFYGVLFRSEEEAAFANYRLWESLGFSIAFAGSSLLCTAPKMYILLSFLLVGMIGYLTVELRLFLNKMNT